MGELLGEYLLLGLAPTGVRHSTKYYKGHLAYSWFVFKHGGLLSVLYVMCLWFSVNHLNRMVISSVREVCPFAYLEMS